MHATERGKPRGRDRIDWKLITNLPVTSKAQAIEKLQWYALRWRIFWLTMINRSTQKAKASLAFTRLEIDILNRLAPERRSGSNRSPTLKTCLTQLARLGGYLNRAGDGPPGNIVIWRGMSRLTDIEIGFTMASENVGN